MDAWELVMRAMSHYGQISPQDHIAAQELLQRAIAIDPDYSQALGLLGASYAFGAHMGWADARVVVPLAERAALAAVRLDSEDSWAHHALGSVHVLLRRHDDAIAAQELALHLNPSFAQAHNFYASALASGRWQESIAAINRAMRLNPRGTFVALNYAAAAFPLERSPRPTRRTTPRCRTPGRANIRSTILASSFCSAGTDSTLASCRPRQRRTA